jgi:hypothetical protein
VRRGVKRTHTRDRFREDKGKRDSDHKKLEAGSALRIVTDPSLPNSAPPSLCFPENRIRTSVTNVRQWAVRGILL